MTTSITDLHLVSKDFSVQTNVSALPRRAAGAAAAPADVGPGCVLASDKAGIDVAVALHARVAAGVRPGRKLDH